MKAAKIAMWIVVGLTALWFATLGLAKFMAEESLVQSMASIHYNETFTRLLGLGEMAAAAGLIVAGTRRQAAQFIMILMAGAIGSHIAAGQGIPSAVPAAVAFLLGATIILLDRQLSRQRVAETPAEERRFAAAA
jgi:uncharacterized membrane protein